MKKVSRVRRNDKGKQVVKGEKLYVGIDVHKKTYHVAIWSSKRGLVETWVQPAVDEVVTRQLERYGKGVKQVVYEAGPTGYDLVRRLRADGFCADVIAPSKTPRTVSRDSKSDRLDCRKLAEFAANGMLRSIRIPTRQEEADRQLIRLREQMARKRKVIKNQIRSFLLRYGIAEPRGIKNWSKRAVEELRSVELLKELRECLDIMLEELEHAEKQVEHVTEKVEELAQGERHREEAEILQSVAGVGPVTAMTYRLELIEPERFKTANQVARMVGLAPWVYQTGETRKEGPIMKSGNKQIRTTLVEASWNWVRKDPVARAKFIHLLRKTGSEKKAITAMARRLAIILWHMLVKKERYRPAA